MTPGETTHLTEAMAFSGETLDLHDVAPFIVDKHSSGGVGDKTTLVVGPMVASLGVPVGKMSGRGLSFSGGTLDKLESIPGFNVDLTIEQFKRQLRDVGVVVAGQTHELAPADGKLYCAARCHCHRQLVAADRQLDYVKKDRGGRGRHRARRQSGARRVHGDAARGGRAGGADGRDRPRAGAKDDRAARRHEPAAGPGRGQCAGGGRGDRDAARARPGRLPAALRGRGGGDAADRRSASLRPEEGRFVRGWHAR